VEFFTLTITMSSIPDAIKQRYSSIAKEVDHRLPSTKCCTRKDFDPITRNLYTTDEESGLPPKAVQASLGCGNPTAMVNILPGQIILDLGSGTPFPHADVGGGIDVFLSAKRVGATGKVYGLDMTEAMVSLARTNAINADVDNVEFLLGSMEDIPLPDASVDCIISNCVVNLAVDKDVVLREAYRVLRPGGKFAVSDIVLKRELPEVVRKNVEAWMGCVAGALVCDDYLEKLSKAGFIGTSIEEVKVYDESDVFPLVPD
jgi:SAM-dependent methyltransferase